jgi:hypothetical protein
MSVISIKSGLPRPSNLVAPPYGSTNIVLPLNSNAIVLWSIGVKLFYKASNWQKKGTARDFQRAIALLDRYHDNPMWASSALSQLGLTLALKDKVRRVKAGTQNRTADLSKPTARLALTKLEWDMVVVDGFYPTRGATGPVKMGRFQERLQYHFLSQLPSGLNGRVARQALLRTGNCEWLGSNSHGGYVRWHHS